jgi:hypothetical protein
MDLRSYFSRGAGRRKAGELEAPTMTVELELDPAATLQLELALEMIRSSFTAGDFGASSRAEAVHLVADRS